MRYAALFLTFAGWTVGRTVEMAFLLPVVGWNLARLINPVGTRHWVARRWPLLTRSTILAAWLDSSPLQQSPARRIWERTNALGWLLMDAQFLWTALFQR